MANCCIIGLGYIGLPSAICIANAGHKVLGIDIDIEKINKINSCVVPINEPNLKEEFKTSKTENNIKDLKIKEYLNTINSKSKHIETQKILLKLKLIEKELIPYKELLI